MAIQSASATFTRFYIEDPVKRNFWDHIDKGLKAGCFKETTEVQSQSVGFALWDDLFDASFDYSSYHKGEYVAFHFRVDQRKIPAILQKQYIKIAIEKYRDKNDGKWPSRKDKEEIREKVTMQLLSKALPQPTACEVVWNTQKHWLLVGTTSKRILNPLWEHIENHFQAHPVPLYHIQWAFRLLPERCRERDTLASLVSVETSDALFDGLFLGYEFLTWLWFFSETSNGRIKLADNRKAELDLGDRIILCHPDDGLERVVCTTQVNNLHEARTALQHGKMVEEVQIYLKVGDNEYFLGLDTKLWAIKSLRTPKQIKDNDEEDQDGRFLEKMFFLEEVFACLDAVYMQFLSQRLSSKWDAKIKPLLQKWFDPDN